MLLPFDVYKDIPNGHQKTLIALGLLSLNRLLVLNYDEVIADRQNSNYKRHLPAGTSEQPQSKDAKCPSHNPFGILCPCVDSSPAKRLKPTKGPTLIVVPLSLIPVWLGMCKTHLDLDLADLPWTIRAAHGSKHDFPKLSRRCDSDFLCIRTPPREKLRYTSYASKQCTFICVTTVRSYNTHVKDEMSHQPLRKSNRGPMPAKVRDHIGFGRFFSDESHVESGEGSPGPSIAGQLTTNTPGLPTRQWMITGTPFESSPAEMVTWVRWLENKSCLWSQPTKSGWDDQDIWRAKLKSCTRDRLIALGKTHNHLVSWTKKSTAYIENPVQAQREYDEMKEQYIRDLQEVLSALWLRRDATESKFFGHPLVELTPNVHRIIRVSDPNAARIVNTPAQQMAKSTDATYQRRLAKWEAGSKMAEKPKLMVNNFLDDVRALRILSSFPALKMIEQTKDLKHTGQEIRDKGWCSITTYHPYNLQRTNSPYEKHIAAITRHTVCPKVKALGGLIDEWDKGEKAVVACASPVSSLLTYLVRSILNCPQECARVFRGVVF